MKLAVDNPNLSVVMPVSCNANCDFCYWTRNTGLTADKFRFVANSLPEMFQQVSITGGEPTMACNLQDFLRIARNRFKKVVLNTNGYSLLRTDFTFCDHVNISRHHWNDTKNRKVFKTDSVPDVYWLESLCSFGDVTLNCFLPDGFSSKSFIKNYIAFAKEMKAKVAFRKYFNNLDLLEAIDTDKTLISDHSCGACRHRKHIINGVEVTFKYSVPETYKVSGGIYELILQGNGDLTFDWAGKNKLTYKED
jgi:molybdenum cofactor biosynthesis enzyme MoaA